MKILLTGNNRDILEKRHIRLLGQFPVAEYVLFSDPLLSVKYCVNEKIDIVISDFQLQLIDGIQMIKLLRSQNPAVIAVLVEEQAIHREDAKNLGIEYLTEPFTAQEIRKIWEQREKENLGE